MHLVMVDYWNECMEAVQYRVHNTKINETNLTILRKYTFSRYP